jgi:hypothetical protein
MDGIHVALYGMQLQAIVNIAEVPQHVWKFLGYLNDYYVFNNGCD